MSYQSPLEGKRVPITEIRSPHRHEEFHVTVTGDPIGWHIFCEMHGMKPLWIELNNFERQLMCASKFDPTALIEAEWDGAIRRIKHEIQPYAIDVTCHNDAAKRFIRVPERAIYFECHVKLDGVFMPQFAMSSRDLYRDDRWYATKRALMPFDPEPFIIRVRQLALLAGSTVAGHEYEACVRDTNDSLDEHWL